MKKLLGSLLLLPLLASAAAASEIFPYRIDAGANVYFRVTPRAGGPPCGGLCGPWYNYWPLEAHFQAPAVPHYPFWPAPQDVVKPGAVQVAPVAPPAQPAAPTGPPITPTGYFMPGGYDAQVPSYWYGR